MNHATRILVLTIALGLCATSLVAQNPVRRVSLDEALRLFAVNNLDLRVARLQALEFRAAVRQAGAFGNPTINVTHEPLSGVGAGYSESYFTLSQRLEFPGQRRARTEGAVWGARAAEARSRADSVRLAFEVKRTYVEAVLTEELLAVTERVVEVFRETARSAVIREAQGDISRYELRRILVERSRYENLLADAEIRASSARRGLALLILPESDFAEVSAAGLDDVAPPEPVFELVPEELVSRRQEIASAQAAVEEAVADVQLRRAERVPDVTATGGYKRQSDGLRGAFLGVSIPIPLFNRNAANVAGAEARVGTVETRLALTRRQVGNDLRRAIESYESVKRRADLLGDDVLDASSDLLQIAQVAYDLGEMGLLEILDAAAALRGARNARVQLKADLWTAYYDLERAVGGFDATPELPTTDPEMNP